MSVPGPGEGALRGERALVTGATGFLGSHLRLRLLELGAEVHGVSRSNGPGEDPDGVTWWRGDFADLACTRKVVRRTRPDVIFHLAGLVTGRTDRALVLPTMESLLVSTVNVLSVACEQGCRRLVLVGSMDEPAAPGAGEPIPASPYAAAKWASVGYGRMFHQLYGTPVVIARTFMAYGPMQEHHKLVPHVILSLLRDEAPKLSTGERLADWIYVDDVIEGFIAAAQAPGVEGRLFEFGSGIGVSNRAIVDEIVTLLGSEITPSFGALPTRVSEPERVAQPIEPRSALGWEAGISLSEGLRRTIKWYADRVTAATPAIAPLLESGSIPT